MQKSAKISMPWPKSYVAFRTFAGTPSMFRGREEPDARVLDWIDAQALETLYLSAITVAELRAGIALMPAGKRRDGLHENLEKRLLPMFANRVLPFDMASTKAYAKLLAWLLKRPTPSLQPLPSPSPTVSLSPPLLRLLGCPSSTLGKPRHKATGVGRIM